MAGLPTPAHDADRARLLAQTDVDALIAELGLDTIRRVLATAVDKDRGWFLKAALSRYSLN
jgi:hypothetical protein